MNKARSVGGAERLARQLVTHGVRQQVLWWRNGVQCWQDLIEMSYISSLPQAPGPEAALIVGG